MKILLRGRGLKVSIRKISLFICRLSNTVCRHMGAGEWALKGLLLDSWVFPILKRRHSSRGISIVLTHFFQPMNEYEIYFYRQGYKQSASFLRARPYYRKGDAAFCH